MTDDTTPGETYLVFIVDPEWDPAAYTAEDFIATGDLHRAFSQAVRDAGGEVLDGEALQPSSAAVRIRPATADSPATFTDGPFGELKELVTGYYKIRVRDREQAKQLAALCPGTRIELWPIFDTTGM